MRVVGGLGLTGPYRSEQEFKTAWLKRVCTRCYAGSTFFEIENEEKEPGFPDVMRHGITKVCEFFEMKVADKKGWFELQKTQPRFYRTHPELDITVVVWHEGEHKVYYLTAQEVTAVVLEKQSLRINIGDFNE